MSTNEEKKEIRKAVLLHDNTEIVLTILDMKDGSYEVKGSGIRVMAVLKQGKDGIEQLHLSGRGAKKYKEEILHALYTEAGEQVEKQQELGNVSFIITENDLCGYDIKAPGVQVVARIKGGNTNNDFGWEGYELSGRGAEKYKKDILDAIEEYRIEHDLHPLYVLPPNREVKVGEVVRVIANMYISKQKDGKRDIIKEKDTYVGAMARVTNVQHSLQYGTQYSLKFLDPILEERYIMEGSHMFYRKEIVLIEESIIQEKMRLA
ncbi:hypothetical protein [Ectobacillus panaciterrae]|uniref:hypothetical protein n=1 Tax=Ectobacillus panaciterrae TaxID=363872 RepID=UPI000426E489|nr:hypothetical protein [Ectobacillus panaciterrae]